MNEATFMIRARDPIMLRDGRPFSANPGSRAESLDWPLPSTLAGAIRTFLGNMNNFNWQHDGPAKARSIQVQGPLMLVQNPAEEWQYYCNAPADAVIYRDTNGSQQIMRLSPLRYSTSAGCNIPCDLLPLSVRQDAKPTTDFPFWQLDDTITWLADEDAAPENMQQRLPKEARIHIKINRETGATEEGKLFTTISLCLPDIKVKQDQPFPVSLLCRMRTDEQFELGEKSLITLGGERRAVMLENSATPWPTCPNRLKAVASGHALKLQLITPALFEEGWKPAWLNRTPTTIADTGVEISRLVSAAIPRRIPVSGWDYEKKKAKPARYACPAGSVFFFETKDTITPEMLEKLWFSSICDDRQANMDGFGLVVPGIWKYASEEK